VNDIPSGNPHGEDLTSDPGVLSRPLFIYASPVPYTITQEGFEFILGSFPPNKLSLEIELPAGLSGSLVVEVFYSGGNRLVRTIQIS
jgi:hypothetical protein